MANIRSPGVYLQKVETRIPALALAATGQPGFLGMATRGPLHEPVRLNGFEDFLDVFGQALEGSYLAESVRGFFDNGGELCYVVRIAHTFRRGRSEAAMAASFPVKDREGRDAFTIAARNEGAWGNEIKIEVDVPAPQVQTFITRDLQPGDTRVQVRSARGIQTGSICKLDDGKLQRYVTITKVEGKQLHWHKPLDIGFKSNAPTYVQPITLEVTASVPGYKETFTNLSFSTTSSRYFERLINHESQLIRILTVQSEIPFPESLPAKVERTQLDGGLDGLRDITPQDFIGFNNGPDQRFGLGALEAVDDIDLIAIPDLFAAAKIGAGRGFRSHRDVLAIQEAMISHCERLQTRLALLDIPPDTGYEQAVQWRLNFDSAFGAFYYPWVITSNDGRKAVKVPPSGHVAGVMARSDKAYGVHKPPANEPLRDVVDLDVVLHDTHLGMLNKQGINCIKYIPGRGIRIWGARTVSSDPQWRFVNVRRIFNTLRSALIEGTQWLVFEPNDRELWKKVEQVVRSFLGQLYTKGFFQGSTPDEAYYVRCDASTNTVENIDAGMLVCEIGIAPVRPAEFITFYIEQEMEDRAAEEGS